MKINFSSLPEGLSREEFIQMARGLCNIPVNTRTAFSSIRRIESACENTELFQLDKDDADFLVGQLEYSLQNRLLTGNKKWETFIEVIDKNK